MQSRLWKVLSRRRVELENGDTKDERLARVLGLFDLTALGVGATLGLGVYVLAGSVAKETAGPAVAVSFLIAAIASAFAGKTCIKSIAYSIHNHLYMECILYIYLYMIIHIYYTSYIISNIYQIHIVG